MSSGGRSGARSYSLKYAVKISTRRQLPQHRRSQQCVWGGRRRGAGQPPAGVHLPAAPCPASPEPPAPGQGGQEAFPKVSQSFFFCLLGIEHEAGWLATPELCFAGSSEAARSRPSAVPQMLLCKIACQSFLVVSKQQITCNLKKQTLLFLKKRPRWWHIRQQTVLHS